jgi:hypothetical protein
MFVRRITAVALLAMFATGPALADDATPAPVKPVKEKKVCRYESPTGSNIPIATCHTKSEWVQIDAANRPDAEALRQAMASSGH